MESLINKRNSKKIPLPILLVLITIYICPNIRLLSVGEMSCLPAFIILLSYSFLSFKEIFLCGFFALLSLISLTAHSLDYFANVTTIKSSLVSYYIILVPILLSIILGRIFAYRFKYIGRSRFSKELRYLIVFIVFIFTLSGIINFFVPSLLPLILFTGRTSFSRLTFFFSEPSQSSSVILFIWLFALQFLFNKKFINFFGINYLKYALLLFALAFITSYLALPGTLIAQLTFAFIVILFTIILLKIFNFLRYQNIYIYSIRRILKIKPSDLLISCLVILLTSTIFTILFFVEEGRFSFILWQIDNDGLIQGLITAGGFRFYYSVAAVYYSFLNLFSLPGDWYGTYVAHLRDSLSLFVYSPGEGIMGLEEGFFNVKPLGWLYFTIYDLGLLGFVGFVLALLRGYLKEIIIGIFNSEFFYISIFAFQAAILLVPVLPSTPCIFIPLGLVSFSRTCKKLKKLEFYN